MLGLFCSALCPQGALFTLSCPFPWPPWSQRVIELQKLGELSRPSGWCCVRPRCWEASWKAGALTTLTPAPSAITSEPRRRKWQPTPVFLPGESHGQRSLAGYSSWDRKSQTRLSAIFSEVQAASAPSSQPLHQWRPVKEKRFVYSLIEGVRTGPRCPGPLVSLWSGEISVGR